MGANHTGLLEREEPRSQLEEALAAARTGRGQIVSVEGEAGIGKTSLAVSFAEAHRRDARVYVGACEYLATENLDSSKWRAREIYDILGPDEFTETFQLSESGKTVSDI